MNMSMMCTLYIAVLAVIHILISVGVCSDLRICSTNGSCMLIWKILIRLEANMRYDNERTGGYMVNV